MNMKTTVSQALAASVDEALARGEDPLGDNDPLEVEQNEDDAQAGQGEQEQAAGADDVQAQQQEQEAAGSDADAGATQAADAGADTLQVDDAALNAEALAAVAADDADPEPVQLATDTTDFKAERQKLEEKEDGIEAKWAAGELSDAERATQLRDLRKQQNDLTRQETRAETIAELNRQQLQAYQSRVLLAIATQSKAAGQLDYTDAKVGAAFDHMLHAVSADPGNEGKSFKELASLAHDALCATRGVKTTKEAASPAPAPAAAPRKPPQAPVTLRSLPAASTPNTGGNAVDALGSLKGQDYQEAFSRLTPAQKAALLDE